MPDIPATSPLGYIGVFLVLAGLLIILASLGVFVIEKITISRGWKSFLTGILLTGLGSILVLFDLGSFVPNPNKTEKSTPTLSISNLYTASPNISITTESYATQNASVIPLNCSTSYGITGKVVDSDTGLPLEGVNVETYPGSSSAITDKLGDYLICNVPMGRYEVIAEKSGYLYKSIDANVTGDSLVTIRIDFALVKK